MRLIEIWQEYWELVPPRKFEEWCKARRELPHNEEEWLTRNKLGKGKGDDCISKLIVKRGFDNEQNGLKIDGLIKDKCNLDFFKPKEASKKLEDIDLNQPHFNYLENDLNIKLIIKGGVIEFLHIHDAKKLVIENSCINDIKVFPRGKQIPYVEIRNSWIGRLHVPERSLINFKVEDSWICAISCPAAYEDNPFRGTVDFKKVNLPTLEREDSLFQGTQQFSNLRAHFEKLQNGRMAGFMRTKELASLRHTDSGISYIFNWIYFLASNYGIRPGLAFLWFIFFLVLNSVLLFCFDGGTVVDVNNIPTESWQYQFKGDDSYNKIVRSALLTFQTVVNPVGIFISKSAFQFKTLCGLVHTFILVLFADAAFIFGSLAIRKRLKIEFNTGS